MGAGGRGGGVTDSCDERSDELAKVREFAPRSASPVGVKYLSLLSLLYTTVTRIDYLGVNRLANDLQDVGIEGTVRRLSSSDALRLPSAVLRNTLVGRLELGLVRIVNLVTNIAAHRLEIASVASQIQRRVVLRSQLLSFGVLHEVSTRQSSATSNELEHI